MPKPAPSKYRTTNWSAYNAALKQRGSLDIWFDPDTQWLLTPWPPGRPARFSDGAIELCLTLKALFNLPLRQVMGLVASLLKLAELARAGLYDIVSASEDAAGDAWRAPQFWWSGPSGRQHRHQDDGRRGMEGTQARGFLSSPGWGGRLSTASQCARVMSLKNSQKRSRL